MRKVVIAPSVAPATSDFAGERGVTRLVQEETDCILKRQALIQVLNVGCGPRCVIESQLVAPVARVRIDRVDLIDSVVKHPLVGNFWQANVENMPEVPSETYDIVFANYVLEHLRDLEGAISEIGRVLVGGGLFVCTVPNPTAPEFMVARHTPHSFHRLFQPGAFETHYAFRSLNELAAIFDSLGFTQVAAFVSPVVGIYLSRIGRIPGTLGGIWDRAALRIGWSRLLGDAMCAWRKGAPVDTV